MTDWRAVREGRDVYVNLNSIPAWVLILTEFVALGMLGITLWCITRSQFRRRIPVVLTVVAVLTLVQAHIQERSWRVAVWLIVVVSLTFALSALGRRGRLYRDYWMIEQKFGKKSKEINSYALKVAGYILVIGAILLILSAVFIKGAYSQGAGT